MFKKQFIVFIYKFVKPKSTNYNKKKPNKNKTKNLLRNWIVFFKCIHFFPINLINSLIPINLT